MRHLVALTAGLFVCQLAFAADDVAYRDEAGKRKTAKGKITEESKTEVVLDNKTKIPVYQIESVKYDSQPPELTQVYSKIRQGRHDEAITDLKEIWKEAGDNENLANAIVNLIVQSSIELAIADPTNAAKFEAVESAAKKLPDDTRHFYAVKEAMGKLYLAKGDAAKAEEQFSVLKKVDWPGYKEKATIYLGVSALRQKRHGEAKDLFQDVINSSKTDANTMAQKYSAQVYLGEVLVGEGKAADAEKLLRKAVEEIPSESAEVLAVGRNALGDALRAGNKPKDALIDGYMWVLVVYNQNPEQTARALFNLSQLFTSMGDQERAARMMGQLKQDYPASTWAQKTGG